MEMGLLGMIRANAAAGCAALFLVEMLTARAMQNFEGEAERRRSC